MYKKGPPKIEIEESIFHDTAADCFLQFERYRLQTNLVGINLDKQILPICYQTLEGRMIERYEILYERLRDGLSDLYKNFTIAQASNLRALNNVIRNYRRRVGILGNEPLSNFKYNRFDKSQKMLLESLLYNDMQNYEELLKFQQELQTAMDNGKKEIQESYVKNDKIKEDPTKILDVIDKTECYCFKYYDNFQRSMMTVLSSMESYFDKANGFLTVWENIASVKAFQIKSRKELDMQDKSDDHQKKFGYQQTIQQLEELLESCPPNSIQRDQYRRRLNELRHIQNQREKKLESIGRMFNKRKNRAGILLNKRRDINLLDWYFDFDGNRESYSYQDEFKNFTAQGQLGEFKPTEYEIQKPFKKEKIEEIKQHLQKYQEAPLNVQWWYDKYGKEGSFDLIHCNGQQIQKRVEFQMTRQYEFQCTDDRRKRELLEKRTYHMREAERRESLRIGYLNPHDKKEMEFLQEKNYSTDYWPISEFEKNMEEGKNDSSIEFSDDSEPEEEKKVKQNRNKQLNKLNQYKKTEQFEGYLNSPLTKIKETGKNADHKQIIGEARPVTQERVASQEIREEKVEDIELKNEQDSDNFIDGSLQERIIFSYFKEYSKKVVRKQDEPLYKKTKFLYYSHLETVEWQTLINYADYEKIFIYLKNTIIYFKKLFSGDQERIKCKVYTIIQDLDEETLGKTLKECFGNESMTVVKFVSIYPSLDDDQIPSFMIGLLLTLVRCGQMPQDYDDKSYVQEGKNVVEDFNYYFDPQFWESKTGFMKKSRPNKPTKMFLPSKNHAKEGQGNKPKQVLILSEGQNPPLEGTMTNELDRKAQVTTNKKGDSPRKLKVTFANEEVKEMSALELKKEDEMKSQRKDFRQRENSYETEIKLSEKMKNQQYEQSNNEDDYESL